VSSDDREFTHALASIEGSVVDLFDPKLPAGRPWTDGMPGFMRPGTRAIWFGDQGEGKSCAALTACVDVVEAVGEAVYVDLENGVLRTRERLDDILSCRSAGVVESMKDSLRWTYLPGFDFHTLDDEAMVRAWVDRFKYADLIVLDSWGKIFGQLGLNEERLADVQQFVSRVMDPLVNADVKEPPAVLILDNVGHSQTHRPQGARTKTSVCELAYRVTGGKTCSKDKHGTISLKRTRKRDGDELLELALPFGGGEYGSIGPPTAGALDAVKEAVADGPLSKTAVYEAAKDKGVAGKKATFLKSLDEWAAEPGSGIALVDGKITAE
jgi:hypothetical protein